MNADKRKKQLWKEKYQYYIKEKKNAAVARPAMPSVRKKLFLWWRMKRDLNIHRLMKVSVCDAISV